MNERIGFGERLNRYWILLRALLVLLMSAAARVFAHDYSVSVAGGDAAGDGSRTSPWWTTAARRMMKQENNNKNPEEKAS